MQAETSIRALDTSTTTPFACLLSAAFVYPPISTGKERDAETGLDNFGARFYASTLGRFMSPDWDAKPAAVPYAAFGDPQTLNLYSYVENAPLNRVDADGHAANKHAQNIWVGDYVQGPDGASYLTSDEESGPNVGTPSQEEDEAAFQAAAHAAFSVSLAISATATVEKAAQQQSGKEVNTVYNETSGLRPDTASDPNSAQNLQTARQNVAHVYENTNGNGFQAVDHLSGREQSNLKNGDPNAVAAMDSTKQAVAAAHQDRTDPTHGATHIYLYDLSPNSTQRVPAWVRNGNPTTVQGPFINAAGGGDVRAGSLVLILTIKDQR